MLYNNVDEMNISKIVLGTDYYGTELSENECFYMYDTYKDFGGNCIDTANIYAKGLSEETLGKWLKTVSRDKIFVSTKGAHPNPSSMHISRLSEKEIEEDLNLSLKRLDTDYIDLYWLHRDDVKTSVDGIMEALNKFIKQGKIRNIGASNWTAKRINEANEYAEKCGLKGFCASQIKWSLAKSSPDYVDDPTLVEMNEAEYEAYSKNNVSVFAYASQGKGFFSKIDAGGEDALSPKAKERYLCKTNLLRYEVLKEIAKDNNISISQAVLSYIYSDRSVNAFPIIGPRNKNQIFDCLGSSDYEMSERDINKLKSIK